MEGRAVEAVLARGAPTRAALVGAARHLFCERGYHGAATEEIVATAGVTRGALYYYFRDKEALFEAVFRELETDLHMSAAASAASAPDRWTQLQEGLEAFLRVVASRPDIQRVLLVDGPAIFGWSKWRDLQGEFTRGLLLEVFADLAAAGVVREPSPRALAHLVLGALNEAALLIANSDEPESTRIEVTPALAALLRGLR